MRSARFWMSSAAAAGLVAATWALAVPLITRLRPREGLRTPGGVDLWLLGVFTAGVLAILLGLSVVSGGPLPGRRAREALERWLGRPERGGSAERREGISGWWVVAVGFELLAIYVASWWLSR